MAECGCFFDSLYPEFSQRLHEFQRKSEWLERVYIEKLASEKALRETVEQYKKKMQRIEQFLIDRGLISLLGKEI